MLRTFDRVCVCMCVSAHVCMHVHCNHRRYITRHGNTLHCVALRHSVLHAYTRTRIMHNCKQLYGRKYAHKYTYTPTHLHTRLETDTHARMRTCRHKRLHAHTHTDTHTHTLKHAHARTHARHVPMHATQHNVCMLLGMGKCFVGYFCVHVGFLASEGGA